MAETEYMRLSCRGCGVPVSPTLNKDGTPRKNQSETCSGRCEQRKLAGLNSLGRACLHCGDSMQGLSMASKHCSPTCRERYKRRTKAARPPIPPRSCKQCNGEYRPSQSKSVFCSKACKVEWHNTKTKAQARAKTAERKAVKMKTALILNLRRLQEQMSVAVEKQAEREAAAAIAKAMLDRPCAVCGGPIGLLGATWKSCVGCRSIYSKEMRKADKGRRKARMRGAATAQTVRELDVLERDGWTCYLCGIPTPRRLRGTCEPNAPEIEHMQPISRGGQHSYANTRCACRRCNAAKNDMTVAEFTAHMHQRGAWVRGRIASLG